MKEKKENLSLKDLTRLEQTYERLLHLPEPEEVKNLLVEGAKILGLYDHPCENLDNKTIAGWYQDLEKAPLERPTMSDQEKKLQREGIQECLKIFEFQASYFVLSQFFSLDYIQSLKPDKRKELYHTYALTQHFQFPFLVTRQKVLRQLTQSEIIDLEDYGLNP